MIVSRVGAVVLLVGSATVVALYRVEGGGHTVPEGSQYMPRRLVGNTNRDIDGLETIWQFFAEHVRD